MSKKTNALKKRKPSAKRKNTSMRRYGSSVPIFNPFGTLSSLLDIIGVPRLVVPIGILQHSWVCDSCGIRVDAIQPTAARLNFCPKCRGPLRRLGADPVPSPHPNAIDAEFEDVTHSRLPAPAQPQVNGARMPTLREKKEPK
jgi:hypothetical protein